MPGRIQEIAVNVGQSVEDVLNIADLSHEGYEIKIDGVVAGTDSVVTDETNLILLAKQVKGNANGIVKVGVMPGRINEYSASEGTTIADLLELAELSSEGYEIKMDGVPVTLDTVITDETNLVLLAKQVKGNSGQVVKVGVMPGRINEFSTTVGTTVGELLDLADLSSEGYEIKMDGVPVGLDSQVTSETNLVLLAKQVKGN